MLVQTWIMLTSHPWNSDSNLYIYFWKKKNSQYFCKFFYSDNSSRQFIDDNEHSENVGFPGATDKIFNITQNILGDI